MKVSVVVPAYKRVAQTVRTIELLLASTGLGSDGFEVIVSDSSPDDELKSILEKAFGTKIRLVRPEKTGIAANKNHGAGVASGDILVFCDSDIEVEKQTLSLVVAGFERYRRAAAIGGRVLWRGGPKDGERDRPRPEDRMVKGLQGATYVEALYSRFMATYKRVFVSVGGYDADVFNMRGEGADLSIRYWRAGFPLAYEESIVTRHVHDVPDAAAVRVEHPEWGIAKDLLLLAYKYQMFDADYANFIGTVQANFASFGREGYFRILQGIGKHMDLITGSKAALDRFRKADKPAYDFKFLEIFSNQELFAACINSAEERIKAL